MYVSNWKDCIEFEGSTLEALLKRLDTTGNQILLISDSEGRLVGTITDGDIRRALLRQSNAQLCAQGIMNTNFKVANNLQTKSEIQRLMHEYKVKQLPVVCESGRVCGLVTDDSLKYVQPLPNTLVVMAGGLGTRLRPITESCPKPLVEVNGHSVLHRLLTNAAITGIKNVVISVRYLSEMIVEAVGNGDQYGLSIKYINETIPLGTAGAMTLLDPISDPVVAVLGDVLIDIDYRDLLHYHVKKGASATMVTSLYSHKVPFGVIRSDDGIISSIEEKPVFDFQINAGVIVVNPDIIRSFPKENFLTQPDIVSHCINTGHVAVEYPYRGKWIDIGTHEDLRRARL